MSQNVENLLYSGVGAKPKIPDGIPPRFPKKPTIRQEGDNLVMECLLEAHPMPEITWYRRDKVRIKKRLTLIQFEFKVFLRLIMQP
jgi:hypothetical protein